MYSLYTFLLIVGVVAAQGCQNPEVSVSTYTTTDATVVASIAFVAEFTVKCQNNVKNLNLYADVNDKLVIVTKSKEGDKYQVSWTEDPKKVSSGDHLVKIYDEQGYAALRKAQRSGEDTSSVPVLTTVAVNHSGTYNGPWFQSEFLASLTFIGLWYFAYHTKAKLLA